MESVNDMRIKNGLMLLLTAFIWGTAFVAQSVGMDYLEPFTFNGVRSLIGGAALLPCIWILQKLNGRSKDTGTKKDLLTGGLACGVLLFAASSLQQIGIKYTTAGKAGFITAFYIVIVPVMGVFLPPSVDTPSEFRRLRDFISCVLQSRFLLAKEIFWYFYAHLYLRYISW